jgi:transposase
MRFIRGLSKDTIKVLERIYKQSRYYQVRQRAQCIKLSNEGYKINELMQLFNVSRLTITNWFDDWDMFMLAGLYDKKGRGRKSKLNDEQKQQVKEWVKQNSKNLHLVIKKIRESWNIDVSKDTIKRILHSLNMSWHRNKKRSRWRTRCPDIQRKKGRIRKIKEERREGRDRLKVCR